MTTEQIVHAARFQDTLRALETNQTIVRDELSSERHLLTLMRGNRFVLYFTDYEKPEMYKSTSDPNKLVVNSYNESKTTLTVYFYESFLKHRTIVLTLRNQDGSVFDL